MDSLLVLEMFPEKLPHPVFLIQRHRLDSLLLRFLLNCAHGTTSLLGEKWKIMKTIAGDGHHFELN